MNCMTIGILIGLGFSVFVAFVLFLQGHEPQICINTLVAAGIIFCSLGGLLGYWCDALGYWCDADEKINNTIKATINSNYDNVVNYHNDIEQQSFVSNGSKYTFDYDDETKTLTVFTDTNANVDTVFVNGVKQNNQKISDKTDKKKDCVSYKADDADKINSKPDTNNSSSSTAVSLQQKIQDKIQSRYSDAVITGFDTIKMSGTFSCDNVQYSFQWKDDMLEVINANDADDVTYYKVAQ